MSGENVVPNQPENDGNAERAEGDGPGDNNSKRSEVGLRRAPVRTSPEERRSWKLVFKLGGFYRKREQAIIRVNPCIRSLQVSHGATRRSSGSDIIVVSREGFPYPGNFPSRQLTRYHLTRELRDGPHVATTLETEWTSLQLSTQQTEIARTAKCMLTRKIQEGPHVTTTLSTTWTSIQPNTQQTGKTRKAKCMLIREIQEGFHVTTTLRTDWISIQPNAPETETQPAEYWSEFRITLVVLLPFLLSLGIGIGLNKGDWTDIPTIQMAWGIATYVVTAAALLGALLGVLSGVAAK